MVVLGLWGRSKVIARLRRVSIWGFGFLGRGGMEVSAAGGFVVWPSILLEDVGIPNSSVISNQDLSGPVPMTFSGSWSSIVAVFVLRVRSLVFADLTNN